MSLVARRCTASTISLLNKLDGETTLERHINQDVVSNDTRQTSIDILAKILVNFVIKITDLNAMLSFL